ncbi:hypothetical protein ACWDBD_44320 [Streptomyces sp. NPDC001118]
MKVAIVYMNTSGVYRVHGESCRDAAREASQSDWATPVIVDVDSRQAAAEWMWGDVATDSAEEGSEQWRELCAQYAASDTRFLPCCSL